MSRFAHPRIDYSKWLTEHKNGRAINREPHHVDLPCAGYASNNNKPRYAGTYETSKPRKSKRNRKVAP